MSHFPCKIKKRGSWLKNCGIFYKYPQIFHPVGDMRYIWWCQHEFQSNRSRESPATRKQFSLKLCSIYFKLLFYSLLQNENYIFLSMTFLFFEQKTKSTVEGKETSHFPFLTSIFSEGSEQSDDAIFFCVLLEKWY